MLQQPTGRRDAPGPRGVRHSPWAVVLGTLLGSLALIGIAFLFPSVREAFDHAIHGETKGLREQLDAAGLAGTLIIYALAVIHIIVPFPAEILNLVAGFAYGVVIGTIVCSTAWLLSALGTYFIGAFAGRPVVERLSGRERLERFEHLIERGGWEILLGARLIPIVPYSLVGFLAGITGVPLKRFTWTTVVGSLPLIIVVVILGSRVSEFSFSDPLIWVTMAALMLMLIASHPIGRWVQRRHRHRSAPVPEAPEPAPQQLEP